MAPTAWSLQISFHFAIGHAQTHGFEHIVLCVHCLIMIVQRYFLILFVVLHRRRHVLRTTISFLLDALSAFVPQSPPRSLQLPAAVGVVAVFSVYFFVEFLVPSLLAIFGGETMTETAASPIAIRSTSTLHSAHGAVPKQLEEAKQQKSEQRDHDRNDQRLPQKDIGMEVQHCSVELVAVEMHSVTWSLGMGVIVEVGLVADIGRIEEDVIDVDGALEAVTGNKGER